MNEVVQRINELRVKKGWSLYELSKVAGISINTVYGWNNTDAVPSMMNVMRVCQAMGITIEQFFCENTAHALTDEENRLLQDWLALSEDEKAEVFNVIEIFKRARCAK